MIRAMTLEDIDRGGAIWLAASIEAHSFVPADFWRSDLAEMKAVYLPNSDGWVHLTGDAIDGFISMGKSFVHCLFVAPGHQRNGIGSLLLSHVKDMNEKLRLTVYKQNHDAQRFYASQGFYVAGDSICQYTKCPEFIMEWTR